MKKTQSMAELITHMERTVSQMIAEATLAVHGILVDNPPTGTPVDTGWASSNWWMAVGNKPQGNDGQEGDPGAAIAQRQIGLSEVLAYDFTSGKTIWITDHVPYIGKLNEGGSRQSPAGFVEAAIDAGIMSVKGISRA